MKKTKYFNCQHLSSSSKLSNKKKCQTPEASYNKMSSKVITSVQSFIVINSHPFPKKKKKRNTNNSLLRLPSFVILMLFARIIYIFDLSKEKKKLPKKARTT